MVGTRSPDEDTLRDLPNEVVQLYVRDRVSSVTRPVKELRGFQRVSLEPGKSTLVELPLGPEALAFYDEQMNRVVEPGTFDVMVGASSDQLTTVPLEVVAREFNRRREEPCPRATD